MNLSKGEHSRNSLSKRGSGSDGGEDIRPGPQRFLVSISYGAMSLPLSQQLEGAGLRFDRGDMKQMQKNADAITRLLVHQILSSSEGHKARQRLTKKIIKTIK